MVAVNVVLGAGPDHDHTVHVVVVLLHTVRSGVVTPEVDPVPEVTTELASTSKTQTDCTLC